jgi:TruD family tRNA pseudouridine synthase
MTDEEKNLLDAQRDAAPHLFVRPPVLESDIVLGDIGFPDRGDKPIAFFRTHPEDLIVEEITSDEELVTTDPGELFAGEHEDGATYYADIVKKGASTAEVIRNLAAQLNIEERGIAYAGAKNKTGISAQRISIRGLEDPADFQRVRSDSFLIKNVRRGKGVIAPGGFLGNRFIAVLRTGSPLSENEIAEIERKAKKINESGFPNLAHLPRFGANRPIAHRLGRLILQGRDSEAIKDCITDASSPRELPFFSHMRETAGRLWGDWSAISELFDNFPAYFADELKILNALAGNQDDPVKALAEVPDEIRNWVSAYGSYLENKIIASGQAPTRLPAFSEATADEYYKDLLLQDGIRSLDETLRRLPPIRFDQQDILSNQKAIIHDIATGDNIIVVCFSVAKGGYESTLLSEFFSLAHVGDNTPDPSGVIDPKEVLGIGTLAATLANLRG